MKATTTRPRWAVSRMPRTPRPPRPWRLKCWSWVRLPNPASVTIRMVVVVPGRVDGHHLVAGPQVHAPHAGGVAAHGPHVVLAEADRHPLP